jgi:hypothetical protein
MIRIDPLSETAGARIGMANLEETLISVWRQALVEEVRNVTLDGKHFPVKRTSRSRLRQVDFEFDGERLRGLEQNPTTNSRWARLAREGKKVMQFLNAGRYIANVADGKPQFYARQQADN